MYKISSFKVHIIFSEVFMNRALLDKLHLEMIHLDQADPGLIQHFCKVHAYAALIGRQEGLSEQDLFTLEAAAYTHDIGIRYCREKYGSGDGKLQEKEGPAIAEELLKRLEFPEDVIERVKFLIAHHHTYTDIQGLDYQILVEADFLVNLYEGGESLETVRTTIERIFRTESGKKICEEMFF